MPPLVTSTTSLVAHVALLVWVRNTLTSNKRRALQLCNDKLQCLLRRLMSHGPAGSHGFLHTKMLCGCFLFGFENLWIEFAQKHLGILSIVAGLNKSTAAFCSVGVFVCVKFKSGVPDESHSLAKRLR